MEDYCFLLGTDMHDTYCLDRPCLHGHRHDVFMRFAWTVKYMTLASPAQIVDLSFKIEKLLTKG